MNCHLYKKYLRRQLSSLEDINQIDEELDIISIILYTDLEVTDFIYRYKEKQIGHVISFFQLQYSLFFCSFKLVSTKWHKIKGLSLSLHSGVRLPVDAYEKI